MAEREVGFGVAFQAAGGARRRKPVPYPLTHDHIRQMCEKRERILRIQFPDEKFADEDEQVLARLSIDDPDQAFQRFTYLMGLWFAWERGYRRRQADDVESTRWLTLNRVPIQIRIAGRVLQVTSRSMAAMARMYRHEEARALLGEKLELIEQKLAELEAEPIGWHSLTRRRELQSLAGRVEAEWEHHLRGLLANALSPDGRAALPEEAPEWWQEVSEQDEVQVLLALWDVGPGRIERGRRPYRARSDDGKTLTFRSLLRHWEPKLHLPPMALEDHDLAQLLTALEDGAAEGASEQELEEALA